MNTLCFLCGSDSLVSPSGMSDLYCKKCDVFTPRAIPTESRLQENLRYLRESFLRSQNRP